MLCHDTIEYSVGRMHFGGRSIAIFVWAWIVSGCYLAADVSLIQAQEGSVLVTTASGETVEGLILAIDVDSVTVQAGDELKRLGFDQLGSIDFGVPGVSSTEPVVLIELIDGSMLNTKTLSIESRKLKIRLHSGGELGVDSRNVQSVRFKTYENQLELGKQWRQILADDSRKGDAIVINRNLELAMVEGIVGDISDDKLEFSIEERTARVSVAKLDAILFYHASGRETAAPVCEVVLTDNSRLLARKLDWNRSRIGVTFASGAIAEFPVEEVAKVRFSLGQDLFLSSTKPSTNDWQPLITSSAILEKLRKMKLARANQSFSGKPLSLRFQSESGLTFQSNVRQFENGFAIQGGGKLAFALNGKYEKLSGLVGFDPAANASGNVLLRVSLDGKTVMEKELIHRLMKNPLELDLSVKDVERVVFQVEYNDGRSTGDQIHLVALKVAQ